MGKTRLRRYSVVVAVCAFLLVVAGGLVTSNDAAMSIPDWPLALGKLIPPLEGGIRFEFGHRVLALLVAILSIILAVWSRRRLAWLAVAAVIGQAVVGGLLVRLIDPNALAIVHACLAELCFGLLVAMVFEHADSPLRHGHGSVSAAPLIAAAALFGQGILGAAVRHGMAGVMPHIAGAAVATVLVMWAGLSTLMHHMENAPLRRAAMALLSLTFSQVFLGIGAYMARAVTADAPQPMPMMVWFTVAHVAVGSLAFGAAVVLVMVSTRTDPMEAQLAHGGMVVA
jgi:cytochrome c oxidase assembly protein subunit 15